MSVTIKHVKMAFKDPTTNEYTPIDAIADRTTNQLVSEIQSEGAAQISAIDAKGQQTRDSIPEDYSALSDEVENLKSAVDDNGVLFQTGSINQWDETWENGFYNVNTGAIVENANYIRSKNLIPVAPSTTYFLKTSSNENYLIYFGKEKEYVGRFIASASATFTTPANAYYIGLGFTGQTYSGNVSINYPATDMDYHAFDKLHDKNILNNLANAVPNVQTLLQQVNSRALQQGYTTYVTANNYGDLGITSIFAFGENKFYGIMSNITETMISGLPEYGHYATIVKFSPTGGNAFAQYLFTTFTDVNGGSIINVYTACGTGSNTITPWKRLTNVYEGKSFDIIGDSYSSFVGWNPEGNDTYFPEYSDTVKNVGQTWWYQISKKMRMRLLVNDSYSGATVCTHVRPAHDTSVAFVNRVKSSMGEAQVTKPKPDVIFVFGGQNDQQVSAEIGTPVYSEWTAEDLYKFAPAFCYLIDYLITWNPSAEIINITNSDLNAGITDAMATVCAHYGIKNIVLQNIDKDNMHPTATGMTQICTQVISALV